MRISVVLDCLDPEALVPFWCAALGYQDVEPPSDDYRVLVPAEGEPRGPVVILQRVPEPRVAKNRMHVDVHPGDADSHIEALLALGATRVGARFDAFGIWWQTLADPEGNELCVVAHAEGP
jgi:hypothetical protein